MGRDPLAKEARARLAKHPVYLNVGEKHHQIADEAISIGNDGSRNGPESAAGGVDELEQRDHDDAARGGADEIDGWITDHLAMTAEPARTE